MAWEFLLENTRLFQIAWSPLQSLLNLVKNCCNAFRLEFGRSICRNTNDTFTHHAAVVRLYREFIPLFVYGGSVLSVHNGDFFR